jgi:thioredoxin 1
MKLNVQNRIATMLAAAFLAVAGCNDLPSTGKPIAGAPDGVAEVMVLSKDGTVQLEEAKFLERVARTDQKLILVDFWAPWCGPCRQMAPSLEALKKKWGDKLDVVKVDVDQNSAISDHLGISSIPDVRIFRNGVQVGDFVGAMPKDEIDALLRSLQ